MLKNKKLSILGFAGICIIILTCVITDIFVLKKAVLLISSVPIIAIVIAAIFRLKGTGGESDG